VNRVPVVIDDGSSNVIKAGADRGARASQLLGFGAHRPGGVLDNDTLGARFGRDDAWIRARTGMRTRRVAATGERLEDLAVPAACEAMRTAGVPPEDVDLLILASCTVRPPHGAAGPVAARAGATRAATVDLNAACAGFCYSLAAASDAIRSGSARHVVVVGVEKMTAWLDPDDLPTALVFGDGAGAVVVGPADEPGIGPVVWGSDGSQAELIHADADDLIRMSGQSVFRWATSDMPPVALEACRRAGVAPGDLAAVVPHQANLRIVDALARSLKAPGAVVAHDGADTGNTSAASVPLAVHRLLAEGAIGSGDLALLIGFGAGLSYAAQVVRVP
jgi:3-oxoacyl-[acyl-carrier-protein] synthase III